MSFNLLCSGSYERWWPNRTDLVSKQIIEVLPDILGVQEAHQGWMDVLMNDISVFGYEYAGVAREDGKCAGEYSAIFYRADLFDNEGSGTFWLSSTPDVPSRGWDGACTRICTWVRLRDKKTGEAFFFMNTHTDHKGPKARKKGSELIVRKAAELSGGLPVYLTGDFNAEPSDKPIKILKKAGFVDIREIAKETDTGITWHSYGAEPGKILDYIFTNCPEREIKKFEVIKNHPNTMCPSDHYAITADI